MRKMRIFGYILIISSICILLATDIITEKSIGKIPIEQKMFETSMGRKAIISALEARDAGLDLKIEANRLFVLLFVSGTALLLFNKIKKIERRRDKNGRGKVNR